MFTTNLFALVPSANRARRARTLSARLAPFAAGVGALLAASLPLVAFAQNNPNYAFKYSIGGASLNARGITLDAAGNIYVADTDNHRVVKYDANRNFLGKIGVKGSKSGQFNQPMNVTIDNATGDIYVADYNNNRVQRFDTNGKFLNVIGSFGAGNTQLHFPYGVTFSGGVLYVTDSFNSRVSKFNAQGTWLGFLGTSGTANGQFSNPLGITSDGSGNIYVVDNGYPYNYNGNRKGRIEAFDNTGKFLWTTQPSYQIDNPQNVAVDTSGVVYTTDFGNFRVVKLFSSNGAYAGAISGYNNSTLGYGTFYSIAVDGNGNVYESYFYDSNGTHYQGIQMLDNSGNFQTNLVGQFGRPNGVAVNAKGDINVVDQNSNSIQVFDKNANFVRVFSASNSTGYSPFGVTTDSLSNVYVTNYFYTNGQRSDFYKFDNQGTFLSAYAGPYSSVGSGNGQFNFPVDLKLVNNVFYVADFFNNRIQTLDYTGKYLNQFGSYGVNNGQFQNPSGVDVDGNGNMYVADNGNNRIQKLDKTGKWLWTVGTLGTDIAQFDSPGHVAVDRQSNVYVSDQNNHRVEVFDTNGNYVTQFTADIWGDQYSSQIQYITMDSKGVIYLTEVTNNRLVVLSPSTVTATPTIGGITPNSVTAGSAAFTLSVTGTGFVAGSQILWNGSATGLTTAFSSATNVSATIPASFVASAGNYTVSVANPGGAVSNATTLTVTPVVVTAGSKLDIGRSPAPTITRGASTVSVTCTLLNTGGATATNVSVTGARLKTAGATNGAQSVGTIPAGGSASVTFTFPAGQVPAAGRLFLYVDYTSDNSGSGTFCTRAQ